MVVRRNGSVQAKALWFLLSAAIVACYLFPNVLARATSTPLRKRSYTFYVQGYQQGRAEAMAGIEKNIPGRIERVGLHSEDFHQEYLRGYRDGYQLIAR
jgi:hypothetical protein